jgi:hypothetical protein
MTSRLTKLLARLAAVLEEPFSGDLPPGCAG